MSWRTLPFAVLWLVVLVTPAEAFRAAIYETWNATAWSGKTPHYTPTLGLYSSSDQPWSAPSSTRWAGARSTSRS